MITIKYHRSKRLITFHESHFYVSTASINSIEKSSSKS